MLYHCFSITFTRLSVHRFVVSVDATFLGRSNDPFLLKHNLSVSPVNS